MNKHMNNAQEHEALFERVARFIVNQEHHGSLEDASRMKTSSEVGLDSVLPEELIARIAHDLMTQEYSITDQRFLSFPSLLLNSSSHLPRTVHRMGLFLSCCGWFPGLSRILSHGNTLPIGRQQPTPKPNPRPNPKPKIGSKSVTKTCAQVRINPGKGTYDQTLITLPKIFPRSARSRNNTLDSNLNPSPMRPARLTS